MNYDNSDPSSRLASGKWRVRHSAWLLAPLFGLGMFSFVGFVYVALRVRSRRFWVACVVACVGSALVWALPSDWSGGIILAVWIGLIVYGFVLNRDYLRWRAGRTRVDAWYNQPSAPSHLDARVAAQPSTEHRVPMQAAPPNPGHRIPMQAAPPAGTAQQALGVSNADYYAPPVVQPVTSPKRSAGSFGDTRKPVDVNMASRDELASLPGVTTSLAERVVSARQRQGAFLNIDDMAKAAGLQPHELVRFREQVSFDKGGPGPEVRPPGLPGVRRLDY